MFVIETDEKTYLVPEPLVSAVVQYASRHAELVGTFLRHPECLGERACSLPPGALLELAAVLELGLWERLHIRQQLDVELPTFEVAKAQFIARTKLGPDAFSEPQSVLLSYQVLKVWLEHFSWEAPQQLGADILIAPPDDEDAFVELLAEFFWSHRKELEALLEVNEENEDTK
ncbi:Hypothetical protein PBC10988_3250 [Planctomycetales bacterium 10988]|nr:Hypothetical protein PBC10988_3250 [Planctomycetales bacterium 10988]